VCDIENGNGGIFGLENLKAAVYSMLKESDRSILQNVNIIQTILNTIDKFTGNALKPPDDMTVLTVGLE